jgi:regulator of sigma E protease
MSLLQSGVIGVLAFIFILGAAVILHEFGHFIVAKLLKIRVETFSVGFGPRLFGKKKGHTDYRVSLIPLGGYVKLGGDESNAPIEGEGGSDIPAHERFDLRPRWQRFLVAVAGPIMNILTAIAIPFAAAMIYGVPSMPAPIVSYVMPGGAAERAGLQSGDRIVSFNGTDNPTWETIESDGLLSPGQDLPLAVKRGDQTLPLTLRPTPRTELGETAGMLDFTPDNGGYPVEVRAVTPGSPAAAAGLQVGDRLVAVGGQEVKSAAQVRGYIRERKAQPLDLTVLRNGETTKIAVSADRLPGGLIGVIPADAFPIHRAKPLASLRYAINSNIRILRITGQALGQVFSGKRSVRDTVSGPIGIFRVASASANEGGWAGVFATLAFLSLNLGIFNLLPIPVLDGGAIFLLMIEGALAKVGLSISRTIRERIQQVGFVMVILLMVFVITNDLIKQTSLFRGSGDPSPSPADSPAQPGPTR